MLNDKRILAVTLARGGSRGVPKKNIRELAGKPLIAYTINEAKRSQYIDDYVVSTDCEEVANVVRNHGARVPFLRPSELSTDTATSASALVHAVNYLRDSEGELFDYVVELMATNPLKTAYDR